MFVLLDLQVSFLELRHASCFSKTKNFIVAWLLEFIATFKHTEIKSVYLKQSVSSLFEVVRLPGSASQQSQIEHFC